MTNERKGVSAEFVLEAFRSRSLVDGDDPYELLRQIGVGYKSSMSEIHLACQRAQRQRELTRERARAWAALRDVQRRLLLDLLFFNPEGFGSGQRDSGRPDSSNTAASIPEPPFPGPESAPSVAPEALARAIPHVAEPDKAEEPCQEHAAFPEVDVWGLLREVLAPCAELPAVHPPSTFLKEKP